MTAPTPPPDDAEAIKARADKVRKMHGEQVSMFDLYLELDHKWSGKVFVLQMQVEELQRRVDGLDSRTAGSIMLGGPRV